MVLGRLKNVRCNTYIFKIMMRRYFLCTSIITIGILLLNACSDYYTQTDDDCGQIYDDGVISVSFDDVSSRTYIGEANEIFWNEDDRLSLFYGNSSNLEYRFDGATGDVQGTISPVDDFTQSEEPTLDAIYAVYPYDDKVAISSTGSLNITLPSEQRYENESFGRGANVMVAVSKSLADDNLSFRNVNGYIKLPIWGKYTVKKIHLRGNNDEVLAGDAIVVASYDGVPQMTLDNDGKKSITLDCGEGVELEYNSKTPTHFWISLPPVVFTKGFTVEVEDESGNIISKSTTKRVEISRNTIQPMAAFKVVTPTPEKPAPANNEIWYTTSDGSQVTLRAQCFNASVKSHDKRDDMWVITFNGELTTVGVDGSSTGAFEFCNNLTSISLPSSVTKIHAYTFYECGNLREISLSDNLQLIGEMSFCCCSQLTEITIPASVTAIDGAVFYGCSSLSVVNSLATTPPVLGDDKVFPNGVTVYVPDSAIGAYLQNKYWNKYTVNTFSGEDSDEAQMYAPNDPDYISSDFSANGMYVALQRATEGNGIDIVLMGDGYSDRQIASGRYEADMRKAMEAFFSKEPYTSFRHLFNVYMVTCVSRREGCREDNTDTAFGCYIKSDGISISGANYLAYNYAKKIFGEQSYEYNDGPRTDESTLIVIMNSEAYAGVCLLSSPMYNKSKNYGNGASLSYFSLCGDYELFTNLLIHESCGHGFAKLGDEYFSSGNGAITNYFYYEMKDFEQWGWFKNVDATADSALTEKTIKWKHFLSDPRYTGLVGIYEGAYSFAKNAYRASDNSIMRHVRDSDGSFNAPSREAIYYRIHKLAYGDAWVYNYEKFVEYDAINR